MRELTIARLGVDGDGIADGPVFVAGTLPAETVIADVTGKRGVLREIRSASPLRVPAPCLHFPACGGCRVQHFRDEAYAAWKTALLTDALARAGFAAVSQRMVRVPPYTRRRADFGLLRASGGMIAGFHAPGSEGIVDLHTCLVIRPELFALLTPVRAAAHGLAAVGRQGSAIVTLTDAGADVLLRTDRALATSDRRALVAVANTLDLARLSWARDAGEPEILIQSRPPAVTFAGHAVRLPPGAFLQATAEGEAAIIAAVLAGLSGLPARAMIVDLYAGCGTLSLPMTALGRVAAYEGDAANAAALKAAAPPGKLTVFARDLVRQPLRAAELLRTDAVVLDPPHAGAAVQVAEIVRSAVRRVVYVTCNPQTLERDAAALRDGGFALTRATPIDQFLWSARLEAVCVFERGKKAPSPKGRGLG